MKKTKAKKKIKAKKNIKAKIKNCQLNSKPVFCSMPIKMESWF